MLMPLFRTDEEMMDTLSEMENKRGKGETLVQTNIGMKSRLVLADEKGVGANLMMGGRSVSNI